MMWYGREDSIGYAMSFNGINWKEGKKEINGLVTGANHPLVEFDANGFHKQSWKKSLLRLFGKKGDSKEKYRYKIWYWDPNIPNVPYSIDGLRYAESKDGIGRIYEFGDLVLYAQIKGRYEVMLFKILPNDYIYIRTMR